MSPDNSRPTRVRWKIVALLMAAASINYLDRGCMGIAVPEIQEEFGLTTTQVGYVLAVFQYGYFLSYLVVGMFVDLINVRAAYIAIMALWSAVGMLTGTASRLWQFLTFRFFLGVAEAGSWPTSNKVVAQWFPRDERPLACGIFDSGSALAQVIGPPILAFIILSFGWRSAFFAAGSLGFVWMLFWVAQFRSPKEHRKVNAAELALINSASYADTPTPNAPYAAWKQLLRCRQIWGIFVLNASTAPLWFVLYNWLPKYFYDARRVHFDKLGWYAALPMVGGVLGSTLGSTVLGRLLRRREMTVTVARRRVFLVDVTMMSAVVPAIYTSHLMHSALFMGIVAAGLGVHAANILSAISDLVPSALVASATSIQASATFLYSLPFATFAGWIVEHLGYSTLFCFAAVTPWFSIVSMYWLIRNFELIAMFQRLPKGNGMTLEECRDFHLNEA